MKSRFTTVLVQLVFVLLPIFAVAQKAYFEFYNSENGLSGNQDIRLVKTLFGKAKVPLFVQ